MRRSRSTKRAIASGPRSTRSPISTWASPTSALGGIAEAVRALREAQRLEQRRAERFDFLEAGSARGDLLEVFEELRQRDLFERGSFVDRTAVLALVADIAARLDAVGVAADEGNREAAAGQFRRRCASSAGS